MGHRLRELLEYDAYRPAPVDNLGAMRSAEVADLIGITLGNTLRVAYQLGLGEAIGTGAHHHWSPGDALAMSIMQSISTDVRAGRGPELTPTIYAEGAVKCGEALDNGYRPAYLVTRGRTENVVVLETEDPRATDEMVEALLLQAMDAGAAVKVVRLRGTVSALEPWLHELELAGALP